MAQPLSISNRHLLVLGYLLFSARLLFSDRRCQTARVKNLAPCSAPAGWFFWCIALATACAASTVEAGGGPENVFLVVNGRSDSSRTIANHFIRLRRIPPINVLTIDWSGSRESVELGPFREKILQPALAALRRRHLEGQIDYLIYSSDFPWRVNLRSDLPKTEFGKHLPPVGSLTGVTYLWQWALARKTQIVGLANNFYAPLPTSPGVVPGPSRSQTFRGWYGWAPGLRVLEAGGPSYLLSTMLGVTSGRGNTVDEVTDYLRRSALADGTHPDGTIYYMRNGDVRSTTRQPGFQAAVAELNALGVDAEVLQGKIPLGRKAVLGLMAGTRSFDWPGSGSTILPGAICEHLTSFGGVLNRSSSQMPLTEFLRRGAAGASGTVIEPYSIQAKFPLPAIQVHYARGCSLAEAFYQSVSGPYQLLIVGDPLCRPWARIPTVHVQGVRPGQTVRGSLVLTPTATIAEPHAIDRFELFVDGVRVSHCRAGNRLALATTRLADGYHELRIVAIESSPIGSQGRRIVPIVVNNRGQKLWFHVTPAGSVASTSTIAVEASCADAREIRVYQNQQLLGRIAGSSGRLQVPAARLGHGPVTLRAVARGAQEVVARPITLRVD